MRDLLAGSHGLLATAFFAAAVTGVSASVATPLGKVVQLLGKLERQVTADGEDDARLYSAQQKWFYNESDVANSTIKLTTLSIAELQTLLAEQEAFREEKSQAVEDTANSLAATEKDAQVAAKKRESQHADFVKVEAGLSDAIDELTRAVGVTEKTLESGSPASAAALVATNSSTGAAHLASFFKGLRRTLDDNPDLQPTRDQREALDDLIRYALEQQDADEAPASLLQRGAALRRSRPSAAAERSAGGLVPATSLLQSRSRTRLQGVIGTVRETLTDLLKKSKSELDKARTDEQGSQHAYKKFELAILSEIGDKKKALEELKMQITQSQQISGQKTAELDEAQELLRVTSEHLDEVTHINAVRSRDFKARTDKRTDELLAIQKATAILTGKVGKRFSKQQSIGTSEVDPSALMQVSRASRRAAIQLARSAQTPGVVLVALRSQAHLVSWTRADPFGKVKGMIQQMLERLLQEQADETTHKGWCDTELATSAQSKKDKEHEVQKLSNRLEALDAELAQLSDEIATIQTDVSEMLDALQQATEIRNRESAQNREQIAEYKDAQQLVRDAIHVLQSFYKSEEGASKDNGGFEASTSTASGIIGILEVAQQDFSDLEKELIDSEAAAAKDFATLQQESRVKKSVFETDLEYKANLETKMKGDRLRLMSDIDGYKSELSSLLEYLEKLKPQCVIQGDTYNERVRRRESELQSLKEALQILEGEGIP